MESNSRPEAQDEAAALADAETARMQLAVRLRVPSYFFVSLSAVIAGQIATTALGVADAAEWATGALIAGLALFVVVGGVQLVRFRHANGVWLGGFASRVVGGTGRAASTSYVLALGAAVWAAFAAIWWLVALAAIGGGLAYGLSGHRWLRQYRAEPATHARGESAAWLAVVSVLALAGFVLLLVGR